MARFAYQGTSKDGNGRVIPSMTISVFLAGVATAADVYTASSGGSAVNSVTSDSTDGEFKFWVDEADYSTSQQFKITLSKTDFTPNTYDDISIYPYSTVVNLNDLDDVEAGSPTNNQSLTWDSVTSKWIPETVSAGGNGSQNLFETISCPAGSNPVADSPTDTLTFAAGSNKISITGDAPTDKVTFDVVEANIDHDALTNFLANEHTLQAVTKGGTGLSTVADGSILYSNSTDTLVALTGASGDDAQFLRFNWSGGNPTVSWESVAVAGGWTDDGTVVRLTTPTDKVGINELNPAVALEITGGDFRVTRNSGDTGSATIGLYQDNVASNDGQWLLASRNAGNLGFYNVGLGADAITITGSTGLITIDRTTSGSGNPPNNMVMNRTTNHTGGTVNFVYSCIYATTIVDAEIGNAEWCLSGQIYNESCEDANVHLVAVSGIAKKNVNPANESESSGGTAPCWGGHFQCIDMYNGNTGTVGVEINTEGKYSNSSRVGLDVIGRPHSTAGGHITQQAIIRIVSQPYGSYKCTPNAGLIIQSDGISDIVSAIQITSTNTAVAIDLNLSTNTSGYFSFAADGTDPTVGALGAAGRIKVDIAGVGAKYIAYW